MKSFKQFLKFVAFTLTLFLTFASHTFSQTSPEDCTAIYNSMVADLSSTQIAKAEQALATGKEYAVKCKSLEREEGFDRMGKYVNDQIARLEQQLPTRKLEQSFDAAVAKRNRDEVVSTAKQLLEKGRPYSLDLMLDIASVGFDNASANPANDKYNADAIQYANLALTRLMSGEDSGSKGKTFGFYYKYKNEMCSDGRTNAIGWMNYTIGLITFTRQKDPKAALPYLYKSSLEGCATKAFPENYRLIGSWYVDESNKISSRRAELIEAAGDKETPETAALFELQMGYIDRGIDAYARAYRQADANPKTVAAHKDSIKSVLKELFAARYEGDTSKMDAYLSKVLETPFIDPTTAVVPVKSTPVEPAEATPSAPVKAAPGTSVKKAAAKRPKKKP